MSRNCRPNDPVVAVLQIQQITRLAHLACATRKRVVIFMVAWLQRNDDLF
jgi:hypothetical protein